jgi:hypothetical protein
MTIRIIVRECDEGAARNVGGPVQTRHRTFDVDLPELEAYLRNVPYDYVCREVIGVELVAVAPAEGGQHA